MCFVALADGAPEVYLSNSPVTYQVIDSSGNVLPFASEYSTVTIGSGVQLDKYRVYDGNFEIYFMRNDYQNSGTITDKDRKSVV